MIPRQALSVNVLLQYVLLELPVHVFAGELDVQRGGLEAGVAKYFLHHPEPGAPLDGVGAKGVSQTVHGGTVDARLRQVLGHDVFDRPRSNAQLELDEE